MGTVFESEKDMESKDSDGLRLSYSVPKLQWASNPTVLTATWLRENLIFGIVPYFMTVDSRFTYVSLN